LHFIIVVSISTSATSCWWTILKLTICQRNKHMLMFYLVQTVSNKTAADKH
jgi:hypothetical protein